MYIYREKETLTFIREVVVADVNDNTTLRRKESLRARN